MKILAVCGCGLGSSMVLKMTADEVLADHGIEADIEITDSSTAASVEADLIITSQEVYNVLEDVETPKIIIEDFMNKEEINEKLVAYIEENVS